MQFTFILCVLIGTFLDPTEGEVVEHFSKCTQFFYKKMVPEFGKTYVHLCQRLHGTYYYATLYNTDNRIPVYSAYIFESNVDGGREKYWSVEPQLVMPTLTGDMMDEDDLRYELENKNPNLDKQQAVYKDYKDSGFDRGHLNPSAHHGGESRVSTYTLTNVVPQDHTLNEGEWGSYEFKMSKNFREKKCAQAYVLVGAIPSSNNWIVKENVKRVNIPEFIWNAFCCVDQNDKPILSGAAIAKNTNENKVEERSLDKMVEFLQEHSALAAKELFSGQCQTVEH